MQVFEDRASRGGAACLEDLVRARCPLSFARLHGATSGELLSFLTRIVGSRASAEECLQDVYVRIWSQASLFDPARGPALAWMYGIARNRALDHLRHQKLHARASRLCEDRSNDPQPIWPRVLVLNFQLSVQSLSKLEAHSIELAFVHGHSHSEIADLLSRPVGTVKSAIRRGLLTLRGSIEGKSFRDRTNRAGS